LPVIAGLTRNPSPDEHLLPINNSLDAGSGPA